VVGPSSFELGGLGLGFVVEGDHIRGWVAKELDILGMTLALPADNDLAITG